MYRSPNSDSPPPRRELSHNRQKNGEHVPRPKNAFIFYRSHLIRSQAIPHSLEPDHRNLSRIAGEMWKKLGDTEREIYVEMARKEKEEHKKKYPNYRYSP
ncbi:HMG-box, partial [Calocera cornea HHB12733]